MRRPALGRGLGELLGQVELADTLVREIPIEHIRPNPYQPRQQFAEESLQTRSLHQGDGGASADHRKATRGARLCAGCWGTAAAGSEAGWSDYHSRYCSLPNGAANAGDGASGKSAA